VMVLQEKKDYDTAWKTVEKARTAGVEKDINAQLLEDLKKASGREK